MEKYINNINDLKSQYINIKLNNNLIQNKKINLKQVSDQSRKNVADQSTR